MANLWWENQRILWSSTSIYKKCILGREAGPKPVSISARALQKEKDNKRDKQLAEARREVDEARREADEANKKVEHLQGWWSVAWLIVAEGGGIRKSVRLKAPAKDFFAGDFVGNQWNILKCSAVGLDHEVTLEGTRADNSGGDGVLMADCGESSFDVIDCALDAREMAKKIIELRTENDNLVITMSLQAEELQGKALDTDNSNGPVVDLENCNVKDIKIQNIVAELIKTKKENTKMRLYLNVLAEKINKIESGSSDGKKDTLTYEMVHRERSNVIGKKGEESDDFDIQFPPLGELC
ncbi:hypothetical protein LguiA_002167 [Lonicera macranthoides]